ncbi:hypothetical protein FB451DRAFT_1413770 [Mycena latifolia]|nr:hypothetical protein FB451DRAFT_1413770 [Mycena latifolia]
MQRAQSAPPSALPPSTPPTPGHESAPQTSRRPSVMTMTPARVSLYAESRAKQASTASEWFGESVSESEVEDLSSVAPVPEEEANGVPITPRAQLPPTEGDAKARGLEIVYLWSYT